MRPVHYPKADRTKQWFGDKFPGATMPRIDKLLLHTTEGGSWPPYEGGGSAPTLTYHPVKHVWRQHFGINQSARALAESKLTAVRENRANVVQVEIICSCDPVQIRKHDLLDVRDLDDQALRDLGEFAAWLHEQWDLKLALAPEWLPFPASSGSSKVRMSGKEYAAFRGILGHMHAPAGAGGEKDPGNFHGDPGALDVRRIHQHALGTAGPALMRGAGQLDNEEGDDVKPDDVVGFEKDPKTGKKVPITLEVFVGRMTWMYRQLLEQGKVDAQLDRIEGKVAKIK